MLLDEPTTGLDPGATAGVNALLASLRASGKTIVLSTHDLALAQTLADEVALLSRGRLLGAGPVPALEREIDALYREPAGEGSR